MIPTPAELATAIDAPERRPLVKVSVDWDGDGHGPPGSVDDLSVHVEALSIDRQLAGDLPDEVTLLEGSAAASLDITLGTGDPGDETRHAPWWFSRHNPASPLAGKELLSRPATVDIGFHTEAGARVVRRFTGRTRTIRTASAGRTVRLSGLDLRERLGWPVGLPILHRGGYGLNATWVISEVLRQAEPFTGYVAAPSTPEARLYVPMHGSLHRPGQQHPGYTAAMIASYGYPATTTGATWSDRPATPTFLPGPHLAGCHAGATAIGRYRRAVIRGHLVEDTSPGFADYLAGRVEFHTRRRPAALGETGTAWRTAAVLPDAVTGAGVIAGVTGGGQLALGFFTVNPDAPIWTVTGPTVPVDNAWHSVGIGWDALTVPGTVSVTFRLDAGAPVVTSRSWTAASLNVVVSRFLWRQPVAELALTPRPDFNDPPWLADLASTINVVLDYSTLELDAITEAGPKPAWDWLRQIAAAEQAIVQVDELGVLRYRTARRLTEPAAQTPVRAVTAESSLLDLAVNDSVDAVRNLVVAAVHPVTVAATVAPVHTSSEVWTVEPQSGLLTYLSLSRPAVDIDTTVTVNRPTDPAPAVGGSFVCVAFTPDGTPSGDPIEAAKLAAVTARLRHVQGADWELSVGNPTTQTVYLATSKGGPVLSIAGRALVIGSVDVQQSPEHAAGVHPSILRHGLQVLRLPDNPWRQNIPATQSLVHRLVYELFEPRPVVRELDIVGDPRLQLGDRIHIQDRDGLALNADYWITAIRDTFTATGGYRQRITARPATATLRWGVGRWGTNTWGIA